MKLQHLKIAHYKNLKNLNINFSDDNVTVLMGTNGSGKSNILEVLSKVFYDNSEHTTRNPINSIAYECSYFVEDKCYEAICRFSGAAFDDKGNKLSDKVVSYHIPLVKPTKVISVYSGEEKRLWEDFYEEIYLQYIQSLMNKKITQQKMLYINKYHWAISLLLLAIYSPDSLKKFNVEKVTDVFFTFSAFDALKYEANEITTLLKILSYAQKGSKHFVFEDIKKILLTEYPNKETAFNLLVLASLPKQNKFIENIEIFCDDHISLRSFSEGEKKIIIIESVYELLADKDTLILLDEPDSHIHESRKKIIYDITKKYSEIGVCTVMTSHSPTMTKLFDKNNIRMLINDNGAITIADSGKIEIINKLTDGMWSFAETNIFLQSKKPLLLLEGKSDIALIRQAIKVISGETGKKRFQMLDFDFLAFGGKDNAKFFYDEMRKIDSTKKIILCLDNEGNCSTKLIDNFKANKTNLDNNYYHKKNNDVFMLLPRIGNIINFSIEDYFEKAFINNLIKMKINNKNYKSFSSMPDLKKAIKEDLANDCTEFTYVEMKNFEILLEKLLEIVRIL